MEAKEGVFTSRKGVIILVVLVSAFAAEPQLPGQENNHEEKKACENEQKPVSQMARSVSPIFDGILASKLTQIPRRTWPEAKALVQRNQAVVITGVYFFRSIDVFLCNRGNGQGSKIVTVHMMYVPCIIYIMHI